MFEPPHSVPDHDPDAAGRPARLPREASRTSEEFDLSQHSLPAPDLPAPDLPVPDLPAPQLKEVPESPLGARALRAVSEVSLKIIDRGLNWLATDPKAQLSAAQLFGKIGIDLVPVLGPLKKFADARALYREDDPLMKSEGKKLFVIAVAEAMLDIGTLGGSAFMPDEALTYLRSARDMQRQARAFTSRIPLLPDPLSVAATLILKIPGVDAVADRALRFAAPAKPEAGQPQVS